MFITSSMKKSMKEKCMRAQLSPTLCDPMDHSPPGSSLHGIFQARILEWVAISASSLPNPEIEPMSPVTPALAGRFFTTEPLGKIEGKGIVANLTCL